MMRFQEIITKLNSLDQQEETCSNVWATGHGINQELEEIFGEEAHIIHPNLSSIHSPTSQGIDGVANYIKEIQEIIRTDGGELKKPIIAIWNTGSIRQKEGAVNLNAEGGLHWQTLVILPKQYKPFNGGELKSNKIRVFFKDSLYPERKIPELLKYMLKNAAEYSFKADGQAYNQKIGGIFKDIDVEFLEAYKHVIQQEGGADCGWWAVYNAVMVAATGDDNFLRDAQPSRELGYKLRSIFSQLSMQAGQKNISQDNYDISREEKEAIEVAIKNSLKEQVKEKDSANKLENINLDIFSSYYLSLFFEFLRDPQNSNIDSQGVYQTVLGIMDEDQFALSHIKELGGLSKVAKGDQLDFSLSKTAEAFSKEKKKSPNKEIKEKFESILNDVKNNRGICH